MARATRGDQGRADGDPIPARGRGVRRVGRGVRVRRAGRSEGADRAQPRRLRGDDVRARGRPHLDGRGPSRPRSARARRSASRAAPSTGSRTPTTRDATALAIVTPGILGPDYFRELATVVDAAAGGPPDLAAIAAVMRKPRPDAGPVTPASASGRRPTVGGRFGSDRQAVANDDVFAHPRQLEHVAGNGVGRRDDLESGAFPVELVGEPLQEPQALTVDVRDLCEVDDDARRSPSPHGGSARAGSSTLERSISPRSVDDDDAVPLFSLHEMRARRSCRKSGRPRKAESYRRPGRRRVAGEVGRQPAHDVGAAAAVIGLGTTSAAQKRPKSRTATSERAIPVLRDVDVDVDLAGSPSPVGVLDAFAHASPTASSSACRAASATPCSSSHARIAARSSRNSSARAGKTRWKPGAAPGEVRTARTATSSSRDDSTPSAATRRSQTSRRQRRQRPASLLEPGEPGASRSPPTLDEAVRVEHEQGARLEHRRRLAAGHRRSRSERGRLCAVEPASLARRRRRASIGGWPAEAYSSSPVAGSSTT